MTNVFEQGRQKYAHSLKESWQEAGSQAQLLNKLSLHHVETIGQAQTDVMRKTALDLQQVLPKLFVPSMGDAFSEYLKDAGQRWVLFLDTLCRRGDACILREKEGFKPVLAFDYDMIIDTRLIWWARN